MGDFSSPKKGSNIICRVSNATPEMVCRYVSRLPKHKMREEDFREYMGKSWFQNEHQAPEQWGLYYIDGTYYYPRFDRDITTEEAERYLYGWIKRLIVINPYTRFQSINDNRLVESIVKQLEINPDEHDLKTIFRNIIQSDEPFIVNEIIANALNTYSEVLSVKVIDKDNEKFHVSLLPNYKEILKTKYIMTKKEYFESFSDISIYSPLDEPNQIIFFGAPGTGKSHVIKEKAKGHSVIRTTFHPDSDYATFVGCYKPTTDPVFDKNGHPTTEEKISYTYSEQAFFRAYVAAWKAMGDAKPSPQFLVIEELNRGNCAQIFGDLFQLLDRKYGYSEYPIEADFDLHKQLKKRFENLVIDPELEKEINNLFINQYPDGIVEQIKEGELLLLPKNLYIWATMNTSDQSLFPIDSAFKRRWDWKYMPIDYEPINDATKETFTWKLADGTLWGDFIKQVNAIIDKATESEDKQLGYFFVKPEGDAISYDTFVSKVCFYLWNDIFRTYPLDGNTSLFAFKDADNPSEENDAPAKQLCFSAFYNGNGDVRPNIAKQFVQNVMNWKGTKEDKQG